MRALIVAFVVGTPGCGEDDARVPIADAGRDADVDADAGTTLPPAPIAPMPPAPPEAPRMTPCPAGWRQTSDPGEPGVVVCDPWPEGGPLECPASEFHLPGSPGCEPVGSPCPAGDFPEDLPVGAAVLYVRAGEPDGGDGSLGRPFGRIGDAIAAAAGGEIVAIAKGVYDEGLAIDRTVELRGACASQTMLAPTVAGIAVQIRDATTDVAFVDLTIDPLVFGVAVFEGALGTRFENVVVASSERIAIVGYPGSSITARNLSVRGANDGIGNGFALQALAATMDLERVAVEGSGSLGIAAFNGAVLTAVDTVVRRTGSAGSGHGLLIEGTSEATLERTVVRGSLTSDVDVALDSHLWATDVVLGAGEGFAGIALNVWNGSTATLDRVLVDGYGPVGLLVGSPPATLDARDVVVRDAAVGPAGDGTAIEVLEGGAATVARAAALRARSAAVILLGPDTDVGFSDLLVADTRSDEEEGGLGMYAQDVSVVIDRAELLGSADVGLQLIGGTGLVARDFAIRSVASRSDGEFGYGAFLAGPAEFDRAVVEDAHIVGIAVEGVVVTLRDVAVREIHSSGSEGRFGYGLLLDLGGSADIERMEVTDTRGVGILGHYGGATAVDLAVLRTLEQECGETTCADAAGGIGITSRDGGFMAIERFAIEDNVLAGVQVAHGGTMDLSGGVVSGSAVGANVQDADFDVARLRTDVVWRDNLRNLDGAALPLPEPPLEL